MVAVAVLDIMEDVAVRKNLVIIQIHKEGMEVLTTSNRIGRASLMELREKRKKVHTPLQQLHQETFHLLYNITDTGEPMVLLMGVPIVCGLAIS